MKKDELQELKRQIEDLKEKVKQLEARPAQVIQLHYHYGIGRIYPPVPVEPVYPWPTTPWWAKQTNSPPFEITWQDKTTVPSSRDNFVSRIY